MIYGEPYEQSDDELTGDELEELAAEDGDRAFHLELENPNGDRSWHDEHAGR